MTSVSRVFPGILLAAACSGEISGQVDDPAAPGGSGVAGALPGRGTVGGAAPVNVPLPGRCAGVVADPGRSALRRLNKVQYNNTLQDMLGLSSPPGRDLPSDGTNGSHSLPALDRVRVEALLEAAGRAVAEALARPGNGLLACASPPESARCREEILTRFATRAYRRPALPEDVKKLVDLVAKTRADGAPESEAIGVAMQAVLTSPRFLYFVTNEPATARTGDVY